jgi:HTH-like domain
VLTELGHKIAPSTYYAALTRPVSARALRDEELMEMIRKVHKENYSVYGARKVWWQLRRDGVEVGRCRVERLMRRMGLVGAVRGMTVRTTVSDKGRCAGRGPGETPVHGRCAEPVVGGGLHLLCRAPDYAHLVLSELVSEGDRVESVRIIPALRGVR